MLVQVKFPFVTHFRDYHEGHEAAHLYGKLLGRKVFYDEMPFEAKGYKFVFYVKPLPGEDDDTFSQDKESFIAP